MYNVFYAYRTCFDAQNSLLSIPGPLPPLVPSCCCAQANTKASLFSSSNAAKEIKKATDTWSIGDSVKLQSATCAPAAGVVKAAPVAPKTGRKMI